MKDCSRSYIAWSNHMDFSKLPCCSKIASLLLLLMDKQAHAMQLQRFLYLPYNIKCDTSFLGWRILHACISRYIHFFFIIILFFFLLLNSSTLSLCPSLFLSPPWAVWAWLIYDMAACYFHFLCIVPSSLLLFALCVWMCTYIIAHSNATFCTRMDFVYAECFNERYDTAFFRHFHVCFNEYIELSFPFFIFSSLNRVCSAIQLHSAYSFCQALLPTQFLSKFRQLIAKIRLII